MVKVHIDFWHVFDSNGDPLDAAAILEQLIEMPAAKRLHKRDSEVSDYIEVTERKGNQVFGFVARVRTAGFPGRFNLKTAKRQELDIGVDEGIDEVAHFLYDTELQTFVTQRNRLVRPSTIEDLIAETTGVPITLNPVLRKDKWDRFDKMEILGSFTFRVRGPIHHPDFSGVSEPLEKLLDEAQNTINAEVFELKLGSGRTRSHSLNLDVLRRLMRRIRAKDDNIEKLRVTGREKDQRRQDAIDFIRDRLVFSAKTEYSDRVLGSETCLGILRRAIQEQRQYLKSLL